MYRVFYRACLLWSRDVRDRTIENIVACTSQFHGNLINAVGEQGNWDESRNPSNMAELKKKTLTLRKDRRDSRGAYFGQELKELRIL